MSAPRKKLPLEKRTYEVSPDGNRERAISRVVADIEAASLLGIPFSVTTVYRQAFRHGGNVSKADVVEYVVEVGKLTAADA